MRRSLGAFESQRGDSNPGPLRCEEQARRRDDSSTSKTLGFAEQRAPRRRNPETAAAEDVQASRACEAAATVSAGGSERKEPVGTVERAEVHLLDRRQHKPRQMTSGSQFRGSGGIKNACSRSHAKKFIAMPKVSWPPRTDPRFTRHPPSKASVWRVTTDTLALCRFAIVNGFARRALTASNLTCERVISSSMTPGRFAAIAGDSRQSHNVKIGPVVY